LEKRKEIDAQELAARFMALFDGAPESYGLYEVTGEKTDKGKKVGKAVTKKGTVTIDMWESHLDGTTGLGIVPIKQNTCKFGAIDVDVYDGIDHKSLAVMVQKHKLPLVVCRSKSGGAHLFCFAKEEVSAKLMQKKLSEMASFLGHASVEVFPKQTELLLDRGDQGSWINIPYQNKMRGMRYAVKADGDAMYPEEFLDYAEKMKVSAEDLEAYEQKDDSADFAEGPPCLQTLVQIGGFPEGTRNNGLFNVAVYLRKAHPSDWEEMLEVYNQKFFDPPLKSIEIVGIIKSAKKKDYAYTCGKTPIGPHCNSAVCRTRKFGVAGTGSNFPSLGILSKLDVKPPIWFWEVDGHRIELTTAELQDAASFQRKCMDVLNVMPSIPTKISWNKIVADSLEKVVVIECSDDASAEGQFWEHVQKFCTGKARAQAKDEMLLGKPYHDEELGRVFFRLQDLEIYLDQKRFREFKTNKIASLLKDGGATHHYEKLRGRGTNYWSLPSFEAPPDPLDLPKSLSKMEAPF
jgi:hypothetical protein